MKITPKLLVLSVLLCVCVAAQAPLSLAECAKTTVFVGAIKKTFFDPIGPLTYANIAPPVMPQTNPPLDWGVYDECTPIEAGATVSLSSASYSTTQVVQSGVSQGYNFSAWYPPTGEDCRTPII